jgi:hypothetical protein
MRWAFLVLIVFPAAAAHGQVRSAGMAGAGSAILEGVDAQAVNPARLAAVGGSELRLAEGHAAASNNSYSLADYRKFNGANLTEEDEDRILSKVGGRTIEADGSMWMQGLAYRRDRWAVGVRARAMAHGAFPKELLELALDGNSPGRPFTLDDASGSGLAVGEIGLSHARTLEVPRVGIWHVGATLKYIQGLAYGRVEEAVGNIRTETGGVSGDGWVRVRTTTGGTGYGLDLGAWSPIDSLWSVSVSVTDLLGRVHWTRNPEETIARVTVIKSNLQELEDGDSLATSTDETRTIGSFRSTLPAVLTVGAARVWNRWKLVADWTQGFRESAGATRRPRVAVGGEARITSWVSGRAGISVGGLDRHSLGVGMSLRPWILRVDLALSAREGFVPLAGRGIGAGFAVGLEF